MDLTKKTLDKYLMDCSYSFICLNDAPNSKEGDENYLHICDMLTGESNCYEKNVEYAAKNTFFHIKIPQSIHSRNRINHSSQRHIENLNWFNTSIQQLYPSYTEYDYICHIDSDAFFCKPVYLQSELNSYDLAGPLIYIDSSKYYIHTGLFFINIKTVVNMQEIRWDNTQQMDTGSDICNFIAKNPHYTIKKMGHYDGYSKCLTIPNDHTIISLDLPDMDDPNYKLVDTWMNKSVVHFRAGSCFGVGSLKHRIGTRTAKYEIKYAKFLELFS
jgi:hypothetical protein